MYLNNAETICYSSETQLNINIVLCNTISHQPGKLIVFLSHAILGDDISYQLIAKREAHKRIIWSCSWNPQGYQFATGSRDKTVKLWTIEESTSIKQVATLPPFKESVTALSWTKGHLAVGMDNGLIELWSLSDNSGFDAVLALRFDPFLCHVSTVHRLAWRTMTVEVNDESGTLELASCGADHCVRVFKIHTNYQSLQYC